MAKKLEKWFGTGVALIGLTVFLYGIVLLGYQGFLWLNQGVWPKLPASYVFVAPDLPSSDRQLADRLSKKGFTEPLAEQAKGEVEAEIRSVIITRHILQFVPGWFRIEESWLARPSSWYGVHTLVSSILRFLSIPAFAIILGFIVGLAGVTRIVAADEQERAKG